MQVGFPVGDVRVRRARERKKERMQKTKRGAWLKITQTASRRLECFYFCLRAYKKSTAIELVCWQISRPKKNFGKWSWVCNLISVELCLSKSSRRGKPFNNRPLNKNSCWCDSRLSENARLRVTCGATRLFIFACGAFLLHYALARLYLLRTDCVCANIIITAPAALFRLLTTGGHYLTKFLLKTNTTVVEMWGNGNFVQSWKVYKYSLFSLLALPVIFYSFPAPEEITHKEKRNRTGLASHIAHLFSLSLSAAAFGFSQIRFSHENCHVIVSLRDSWEKRNITQLIITGKYTWNICIVDYYAN